MPSKLDYACAMARAGFYLFPLQANGKRPIFPEWRMFAARDEHVLRDWFDRNDFNIGVDLGASGHVVVDLDVKGGNDGIATLGRIEIEEGTCLPETFVVNTPTGGQHHYLKGASVNSAGKVGQGIDIRAEGGYVVGPGSVIDGRVYNSCTSTPVAEAPPWLLRRAGASRERRESEGSLVQEDLPSNIHRAATWLEHAPPAVSGAGGNNRTFQTAATVRDFGISQAVCVRLMWDHYNPRCEPEWGPDELQILVANAYRYAQLPPGMKGGATVGGDVFADVPSGEPEAAPAGTNPFEVRTRSEVRTMAPPEWQIEGVIPDKSVSMIWGQPGTYKSFVALDMALAIATGRDWHGNKVKRGRVLYIAGEGAFGVRQRVEGWEAVHGPVSDDFMLIPAMPMFRNDNDRRLLADALQGREFDLVVVDTLNLAAIGFDENSASDMSMFIGYMLQLRNTYSTTVLLLHHGTKNDMSERGSSVLRASMDAILHCQADGLDLTIGMRKQKDAEPWEVARDYRMDKVTLADGKTTLVVKQDARSSGPPTRMDLVYPALLHTLAGCPDEVMDHEHLLASLEATLIAEDGQPVVRDIRALMRRPKDWGRRKKRLEKMVHERSAAGSPLNWNCLAAREVNAKWTEGARDG